MNLILFNLSFFAALASFAGEGGQGHSSGRNNQGLFPPRQANLENSTIPEKTTLVSPRFSEVVTEKSVTLKWQEVPGVSVYHLQVATDPNFKWLKVDEPTYSKTDYQLSDLEAGKHYHWRVLAVKPDNWPAHTKSAFTRSMFETK